MWCIGLDAELRTCRRGAQVTVPLRRVKQLKAAAGPLLLRLTLLFVLASLSLFALFRTFASVGVTILAGSYLAVLTLIVHSRLRTEIAADSLNNYRQLEALIGIYSSLQLEMPLPPARQWAMSPDILVLIIQLIEDRKPQGIVELGSGISTVIAAKCAKRNGAGSVTSLEHDPHFASATRTELIRHNLADIATVVVAPIAHTRLGDEEWHWYDIKHLETIDAIDMLIIDGPPGHLNPMARYPALPLLFNKLVGGAIIILDDAARADEKRILEAWMREFPGLQMKSFPLEKGAVVMTKSRS